MQKRPFPELYKADNSQLYNKILRYDQYKVGHLRP
jgi:hypothetical protein